MDETWIHHKKTETKLQTERFSLSGAYKATEPEQKVQMERKIEMNEFISENVPVLVPTVNAFVCEQLYKVESALLLKNKSAIHLRSVLQW